LAADADERLASVDFPAALAPSQRQTAPAVSPNVTSLTMSDRSQAATVRPSTDSVRRSRQHDWGTPHGDL